MNKVHWAAFPPSNLVFCCKLLSYRVTCFSITSFPNFGICQFEIIEGIEDCYEDLKKYYILNNIHVRYDKY